MYYNAARFGSPFDFGATYSLTSNDMTKRSFQVEQTLLGLWHYFLKPPVMTAEFPFLQGIQITSYSYMGKLNAAYTYGGMLACNAVLWGLLFIRCGKEGLKKKGIGAGYSGSVQQKYLFLLKVLPNQLLKTRSRYFTFS